MLRKLLETLGSFFSSAKMALFFFLAFIFSKPPILESEFTTSTASLVFGLEKSIFSKNKISLSLNFWDKTVKKAFFTLLSQKLRDNEILFFDKKDFFKPKT